MLGNIISAIISICKDWYIAWGLNEYWYGALVSVYPSSVFTLSPLIYLLRFPLFQARKLFSFCLKHGRLKMLFRMDPDPKGLCIYTIFMYYYCTILLLHPCPLFLPSCRLPFINLFWRYKSWRIPVHISTFYPMKTFIPF